MNPKETFIDPMDELMARFSDDNTSKEDTSEVTPVTPEIDRPVDVIDDDDDDIYGDNDLANEIAAEEEAEQQARAAAAQRAQAEREANKPNPMLGQSMDQNYQAGMVDFETRKIAIVTTMVNQVVAKHHLVSGGIPQEKMMQVMGDLVDIYYGSGEVITPEFEQKILENWEGGTEQPVQPEPQQQPVERAVEEAPKTDGPATSIEINVEPKTPVTVNIDSESLADVKRDQKITVNVHEVSTLDMMSASVIENSQLDGIITPYDTTSTDMPITLPMSAYRCTVSGASLFDIIKLSTLQSGNPRDLDIKTWQLIYQHIKNPSIGAFGSFDEFMRHTDYRDMELLLWAMFVATADEVETIRFRCGNPKCHHEMELQYNPRSIIHISEELIPDHYKKTHAVPAGKAALEHWTDVHSKKKIYELPQSKALVELDDYSAWDYHNTKIPIMQEVYQRYRPEDPSMERNDLTQEENEEMNFTLLFLLYIKSITINKDGKSYRYTNWRDIEKIVSSHVGNKDISILLAIIQKVRQQESPVSFYIENVECPKCGRKDDRIPVNDIMRALFFQLSSGLTSTSINFVETPKN